MRKLTRKIIPVLLCLSLFVVMAPLATSAAGTLTIKLDVMQLPTGGVELMVYVVNQVRQ